MKKSVLLGFSLAVLSSCTQTGVRPTSASDDSSLRAFLPRWEEAQSRFINGDPTLWKQYSSHGGDATILGAFGGYGEKGWEAVGARYDWAASQYKGGEATTTVEYISIVVSGDLGFTVAIERQEGARVGERQNPERRALRVTQIFRREDGAWRLLHRHADPLVEKRAPSSATGVQEPSAPREWYRQGTGRTVVMLGGGVYGAAMFEPHARELSSDFDVVRVQSLNVQTAKSGAPMPSDYSVAAEAGALHRTLSEIGVTGQVDLVGSSLGAVVALHFATAYPERVRTLTLFEPPAFWILPDEEYERDPAVREMRDLTSAMTPSAVPSDEQLFRFRCVLGACPPEVPSHADPARAQWDLSRVAMRGLAAVAAHREDRERIARLNVPVLLLTGSETVAFHRRINDLLARALPQVVRAELPGGHSAPRTASAVFIQELREFLGRYE